MPVHVKGLKEIVFVFVFVSVFVFVFLKICDFKMLTSLQSRRVRRVRVGIGVRVGVEESRIG